MKKLATLILLSTVLAAGCGFNGKRIKGNGEVTTENRNPGVFEGVSSNGTFDVYVAIGSPASVKIEGESNILPYIETFVDNNILKVQTKDGVWLRTKRSLKIFVTAPRLQKISATGTGDIIGETPIMDSSSLDLRVQGNGKIKLEVDAPEVAAELMGNGGIQLKGQSRYFDCKLHGNGNLKAFDLMAEETKVQILGNGDAEVYASVKLDVSVGGNGDVRYKGNAQPSSHITGNGSVNQVK
ncbi:MAG TPA: head GIN domain-containing protein [Niastella sp.]